jgi:pimeloyl-ACP methyl ester carboxylesterase
MMSAMTRTQITRDGREFTVYDHGPSDGLAIVYHHGTPTSGEPLDQLLEDLGARGARWISYDRPGYGDSSPRPGRSVADAAADCAAILDALEVERFATWGISGGGPHTLACGALLPERCTAVAALAGVAPFEAAGLNYFAGMGRDNWVEFGLTLAGRELLEPHLRSESEGMLAADPAQLREMVSTLITGPDRAVMSGPIGEYWASTMPQAFKHGVQGWVDDDLAFAEPFGFELADIRVPTLIVHGRRDSFVPVAHGEWLAREIPRAEAWILEDEGHLSLLANRMPEVFDWLLAQG